MSHMMSRVAAAMILLGVGAVPASGQATHVVRLIADAAKDDYRFEPATVTVQPNDVIVFRVATGAPHSIVFEGEGLSPGVRGAINSALPGRSGDLSSPLLTEVGKDYRVVVPQMPTGKYPFYCLPHRAYDMRGEMVVK
jgi:plastocyanin